MMNVLQNHACCGTVRSGTAHLVGSKLAHRHARAAGRCRHRTRPIAALQQPEEPDFDQIRLNDDFYRELGLDEDELDAQKSYEPDDIDPMGQYMDLDSLSQTDPDAPRDLLDSLSAEDAWGPKALLCAGLRAEEVAVTRVIMDAAGAANVKVVPCSAAMLHQPLAVALDTPEPVWEQPRQADSAQGGGWGSQRVVMFSGLSLKAVATAVELLEESGLPPLCAAIAMEEDARRPLGQLLAEAAKEQRGRKNPAKQLWEDSGRVSSDLPDVESLIENATVDRLQEIEKAAQEGRLEEVLAEGARDMTPEEVERFGLQQAADVAAAAAAQPAESAAVAADAMGGAAAEASGGAAASRQPAAMGAAAAAGHAAPQATPAAETAPQTQAAAADSTSAAAAAPQVAASAAAAEDRFSGVSAGAPAASAPPTAPAAPSSKRRFYQKPAGPALPPALAQQADAWPAARAAGQQAGQQSANPAAARPAEDASSQQPAPAPVSEALDTFQAKYAFECLEMQREARAAAPPEQPGWEAPISLDWQSELAQVQEKGVTRSDVLAGRGEAEQPLRRFQDVSGLDIIDRIAEEPPGAGASMDGRASAGRASPGGAASQGSPFSRDAIAAALQGGMDPEELKALIDEAAAAIVSPSSFNAQWQPGGQGRRVASAAAAGGRPQGGQRSQGGQQLRGGARTPWQGGAAGGTRRPGAARRNPFEQPPPRRRQEQDRRPAVQTMTVEEMTAAARKLGKNPEAWLKDAEQRGIKVVSEKS